MFHVEQFGKRFTKQNVSRGTIQKVFHRLNVSCGTIRKTFHGTKCFMWNNSENVSRNKMFHVEQSGKRFTEQNVSRGTIRKTFHGTKCFTWNNSEKVFHRLNVSRGTILKKVPHERVFHVEQFITLLSESEFLHDIQYSLRSEFSLHLPEFLLTAWFQLPCLWY